MQACDPGREPAAAVEPRFLKMWRQTPARSWGGGVGCGMEVEKDVEQGWQCWTVRGSPSSRPQPAPTTHKPNSSWPLTFSGSEDLRFESCRREVPAGTGDRSPKSLGASVPRHENGPGGSATCRARGTRGVDGPAWTGTPDLGLQGRGGLGCSCRRPASSAPKFENCQCLPNCAQEAGARAPPTGSAGLSGTWSPAPWGLAEGGVLQAP